MTRLTVSLGGGLLVAGTTAGVWWNWSHEPCALVDAPKVDVKGLGDGGPAAGS
ncbi:hypothetical protein [Streptomyces sp. M41(2017)]|uniref:hypothetical protein n=1 Tax=Streptomyces sp. M41(2017) TaxID=1955065 RepID=UPI0015C46831|nr:hypothetical protein [Streptomyces sp. M41(2017)]